MFYAKSMPKETIRDHTDRLLENYRIVKDDYAKKYAIMDERLWQLLKWAVDYHDVGKVETAFQNRLRKLMNLPRLPGECEDSVPHNFLSVVLIPYRELGLTDEETPLLVQAVGYHHERKVAYDNVVKDAMRTIVKQDIMGNVAELQKQMNIPIAEHPAFRFCDWLNPDKRYKWGTKPRQRRQFLRYVMLKGLLHRLDHAASAGVDVERGMDANVGDYVEGFLSRNSFSKRNLQVFAEGNRDKHLIAVAQTGMGKTEAGLLWIGGDKGFFTLPLRVSINAMYDRIKDPEKMGFPSSDGTLGLLHSSSLDYLERQDDQVDWEIYNENSRQLANKLLVTTVDQILKFPFFYKGFEKEYSVLAGAKVVIDEMQSYDPKVAALIIRALEMIDAIGGKFMIMTATMPKLYLDQLLDNSEIKRYPIEYQTFHNDSLKRHCIKLIGTSLLEDVNTIAERGRRKTVLVICNTVKRALDVYQALQDQHLESVHLLHALFTQKDRAELEKEIANFTKTNRTGVWVTTQLVEASLDIDFDVLFTEMPTLDSLFQRMGRCYRQRSLDYAEPNILIYKQDVSGIPWVYETDLVQRSLALLEEYDGAVLLESQKMQLIEELYDRRNLQGTKFLATFDSCLNYLRTQMSDDAYELDKAEAQNYIRHIHQVKAIPRTVFDSIEHLIRAFAAEKDAKKRRRLRRKISQYTVGINEYRFRNCISYRELPQALRDIVIVDLEYSSDSGLLLNEELQNCS